MICVQVFDAFNPRSKRSVETVAKIYLMRYLFDYAVQLSSPYDRMNIKVLEIVQRRMTETIFMVIKGR